MSVAGEQNPRLLILFSGKRKSGKDFFAEALFERLGEDLAQIIRLSEPIKQHWAEKMGLDLAELLGSSEYKERYRKQMIEWSDDRRREDSGVFCRAACSTIDREIVIVSDVRRKTDIEFFFDTFGAKRVRTIRIEASKPVRTKRGWQFEPEVDDVPSECDLDDYDQYDVTIFNEGVTEVEKLVDLIMMVVN